MMQRQMKLGLYATSTGAHIAGWRHPNAMADLGANIQAVAEVAKTAEDAKLDFIFFADSLTMRGDEWDILSRNSNRYTGQFEPITLLSALAMATKRLGLIGTAQTTYDEPYMVARRFASLDLISSGRAGWNLVTSSNIYEAFNFGKAQHMEHGERYVRAREFAKVVKGLWETFEDDAFVRDKESGIFFDHHKMHLLNHTGPNFSVRGPLNVPRSAQGHPVVVQAGASDPGIELAAETAEVVFASGADVLSDAQGFYGKAKDRLAKFGRKPDDMVIMPAVSVYLGRTEEEARAKFDACNALLDPIVGRAFLEHALGMKLDPEKYPDDSLLPEVGENNSSKSIRENIIQASRRDGKTIRDLYVRQAGKGFTLVNTPEKVADALEHRFKNGAADGFIFMVPFFPDGLKDIQEMLIPELQKRGLFRKEYEGDTLRENLGLPHPSMAR